MNRRKIILTMIGMCMATLGFSQGSVLKFSDYTLARPLINPAAMGQESGANGLLLYRSRFEKSDYWPSTGAFNINSLIADKNFGGGLSVVFDKYGPYEKLFAYVAGVYRLKVNEGKWLNFGLQVGVNYVTNANEYILKDEETIFTNNYTQPNFGFGLQYSSNTYFVGVAIPEFRYNTIDENGDKVSDLASGLMKIYLYGGIKFKMGETTALMPYTYFTYSEYEDLQVDLGAKLQFRESFEFGLQYRTKESFGATVRVKLFEDLWLGYSFEGNNAEVNTKFNSVQEIGLSFHFGKKKSQSSSSEEKYEESINSIRYF